MFEEDVLIACNRLLLCCRNIFTSQLYFTRQLLVLPKNDVTLDNNMMVQFRLWFHIKLLFGMNHQTFLGVALMQRNQ